MSQGNLSLISIPFHGDTITCIETPDGVFVAVKPICESAGLDFSAQRKKLMADQDLFGVALIATPSTVGGQEMVCIPVTRIAAWLFMLQPDRVKPELREKVQRYRREAADVLDRHFRLRDEQHVEEIRQLRGQLSHCHAHLVAFEPKWGQLLAMMETGSYSLPVIAKRLNWSQDRALEEEQAIARCGMLRPAGVEENTAESWLNRIKELETALAREREQRQAEARGISVAALRRGETEPDQPSLFGVN